jgi:EAL domain-containing protein (putative c-di-GMP-specific phosphodiesterase class I)/GGDEF domain-containing protein
VELSSDQSDPIEDRLPTQALLAREGDAEQVCAVLIAAGYLCEVLPGDSEGSSLIVVEGPAGTGSFTLNGLLGAVESLAEDVNTLVELEAIERLASVGRFHVEPGGALRLSEEAARLLDDAICVDEVCDQAAPDLRPALRAWLAGDDDQRSEIIEVTLTSRDGQSRRLRFVDSGDADHRQGFVQARDLAPRCPGFAFDLDESDSELGRRVRSAVASAIRHDHPLAVLVVQLEVPGDAADELRRRELRRALQLRFERCLRAEDVYGPSVELGDERQATEEFLVAVELRCPAQASHVARRLREVARDPLALSGRRVEVAARIGVALLGTDGEDAATLLEAARTAVDQADEAYGVGFACARLGAEVGRRLELERELCEAIERGQIVPYYQPKVDAVTERVVGVEALARWKHPERGLISPAEFIPIAEENGLIIEIGQAVLRQACRDAMQWQRLGIPPVRVAVNLSPAQFVQPDLVERVAEILDETGLPADLLELELTESMLMHDAEAAVQILCRFERMGISLAIDDFGTGYSSLSYLRRLPIDALKIDRSFVGDVNVNPDDAAIATSIILLGRSLKLRVIAEGVETRKQLEFLRVMQCDEIQGFLYSPPVPADRIVELFADLGVEGH